MISLKTISYQCNQTPLGQLPQDSVIRNRPPIYLPSLGFHKPCPYSPTAFPFQPTDSQPLQHAFLMLLPLSFGCPLPDCPCVLQMHSPELQAVLQKSYRFFTIEEWCPLFCSVLSMCAGNTQHFMSSLGFPSTMSWWSQKSISSKDPFSEL